MVGEMIKELKKFKKGSDYLLSVGENKEYYTIYSWELKQFLWDIITNHVLPRRFESLKMEGGVIDGNYFSYEGGVNGLPDKFTAVVGWEKKMEQKIKDNYEKRLRENKQELQEDEIKSLEFHFRRWEGEKLVKARSEIFTRSFENSVNNTPQIQEIADEETKELEQKKRNNNHNQAKGEFYSVPNSVQEMTILTVGVVGGLSVMLWLIAKYFKTESW